MTRLTRLLSLRPWLQDPVGGRGSHRSFRSSRRRENSCHNNNNNPELQTVLPFVEPPIPRPSKYKEFGLPEPKKHLSIKVMEQFTFIRGQKNNVEGVWCKCKWCGKEYGHNVTRLTQHFTSEFAPRQRGNMELPAFRREGSNRHIKGCECASQ
ncbi:hypothetical protein R1flu_007287 [Riccia fluitans]|uniref:BED-type domain-containing protein n=1 Tax=Riccia fluitans TaxID=41844 RepID=A0ABD1YYE4_9MARC